MLNVKKEISDETKKKVTDAIKKVTNSEDYVSLYAYSELNLYVITLITHYAIGYTNNEVVAVSINSDGTTTGDVMRFNPTDNISRNIWGKICLSNSSQRVRITVPGIVTSFPGVKYLPIDQTTSAFEFDEWVRNLNK